MSWNSLFAFANPTGEVGKTFSATGVAITAFIGTTANTQFVQNIASFTALPVGVYSVSVSIPITNAGTGAFVIENWRLGASSVSASSAVLALGSNAVTSFATTCAADASSPTLMMNFTLNNTSGTTPIYINSVINIGATANNQLSWDAISAVSATIVATKLA